MNFFGSKNLIWITLRHFRKYLVNNKLTKDGSLQKLSLSSKLFLTKIIWVKKIQTNKVTLHFPHMYCNTLVIFLAVGWFKLIYSYSIYCGCNSPIIFLTELWCNVTKEDETRLDYIKSNGCRIMAHLVDMSCERNENKNVFINSLFSSSIVERFFISFNCFFSNTW